MDQTNFKVATWVMDNNKLRTHEVIEPQSDAGQPIYQTKLSRRRKHKRPSQIEQQNDAGQPIYQTSLGNRNKQQHPSRYTEAGMLLLGCMLIALSFNLFLNPNQVATGGVVGISTLIHHVTGVNPAIVQWSLNIPLFLVGFWLMGGRFGVKTLAGSVLLPLCVLLTSHLAPWTSNLLLATIYGGIGIGAGLGTVFRAQASTGGLDVAAQIIHKFVGIRLGLAIALIDGLVIVAAGIILSPEKALFALIGLFVTSKTIDAVQLGFPNTKVVYIISRFPDKLVQSILFELDRGLTKIQVQGGYTGAAQTMLMVVTEQREVSRLKALVKAEDPNAFVILSDAAEVMGEGFKGG
jgi:uncharacterized membrane-anchored protein YitT (DUF2179 family)